jgi:hypothetical protein
MKKELIMLTATVSVLILMFAVAYNVLPSMIVYASGTADSYGNRIANLNIEQYISGSWVSKGYVDYNNYTSGIQFKIVDNVQTRFTVTVWLNKTMASSQSEAIANTRNYINITYANGTVVVSDTEMTNSGSAEYTTYWAVTDTYTWSTNLPVAGETYYVYIKYQAYY